ncbi:PEPxxWA-CTERM sorting domain-containing protein [Novosphingobium sp. 9U]|uniref:PEPxxWA-CTERM sorting domain-containing protein n=1 Tax=Novosphingobium sp. 9U TaxID=2653158 RepID=UPI0012F41BAD|nr:PEPxxWA-CTERM sorting domain-containing protein [Novosphingobium sp. 9U]VWX52938.1 conserved hypothetical protein [Novosphingobium sp. 9U]
MEAFKRLLAKLTPLQRRLGGFALLALVTSAAYFGLFARAEDRAAVAATLRNPLSVFSARSPGARVGGALLQTKQRLAASRRAGAPRPGVVLPRERVLSNVRTRPNAPALALAEPPLDARLLGSPSSAFDLPRVGLPGQTPGFDVPSFGGGDVAPSTGGTQPEVPVAPGPAVPEPTTWAMMILGLGAIGWAMRSRGPNRGVRRG